jgi:3-hydroxybutyryl-CoA dehydratase
MDTSEKMQAVHHPRGRYFEEFEIGSTVVSAGRTITETDIVNFAGLAGDYTQIHTDAEYARQTMFGQRVAHGLLVMSVVSGLLAQLGLVEGTVIAFRELTWKFSHPIFIGDTIHAQITVAEHRAIPRLGGGSVSFDLDVINQDDKVVQHGRWVVLVTSRPI